MEGWLGFMLATSGAFLFLAGVRSLNKLKNNKEHAQRNHVLGGVTVASILRMDLFVLSLSALRLKCKGFAWYACFEELYMLVFDTLLHKAWG
jgi:hypothetical protein